MSIFFGKISDKIDEKQISEGYYLAPRGSTWFRDISVNDYAYIIGGNKIQLWKAREWGYRDDDECLWFDIIIDDLGIDTKKFIALKFFKLIKSYIVITTRSAKNRAFFELILLKNIDILNIDIYKQEDSYRKIILLDSKNNIDSNLDDIQLYYEDNKLKIYNSEFINEDILSSFRDNTSLYGLGSPNKDKVIKKIQDKKNNLPAIFDYNDFSIMSFYDTFFCEYREKSNENSNFELEEKSIINIKEHPLNQILYGPPGTGKTYNTINYALSIIDNLSLEELKEKSINVEARKKLVERFNKLKEDEKIKFVTFHQNYSYEDFIQGIKPNLEENNLKFALNTGIFKKICINAAYEFYQLRNNNSSKNTFDFETLYLKFIEYLRDNEVVLKSKTGNDIHIKEIKVDSIKFQISGKTNIYSLSRKNIKKQFEQFANKNLDNINMSDMLTTNATYYWAIINELKNFQKNKNHFINYGEEKDISENTKEDFFASFTTINLSEYEIKSVPKYVFIIDEINRANISRVFGELITLIEDDKRWGKENQMELTLPSGESFTIPPNLYIIGTMNTADKSIALLDIALRRRFEFIPMYPDYSIIPEFADILKPINQKIKDKKGSADFMIGHSFFTGKSKDDLPKIINKKIIPLLNEYFNGKSETIREVLRAGNIEVIENENFQLVYEI